RVVQVARAGERVVDVGDEPFTAPDVGLGMVVAPGPVVGERELGVYEADVGQQPLSNGVQEGQGIDRDPEDVGVASGEQVPEGEVLQAPQRQERQVPGEVTAGGDPLVVGEGGELVPDGRRRGGFGDVVVPVGRGGVLVEAVGEGLPGERAEVVVQGGVVLRQGAEDWQVGDGLGSAVGVEVGVVADREGVGGGRGYPRVKVQGRGALQEPVHLAV